ncbi:type II secretion system protein [Deinococcus pimensis]|uniref:type II secretion system protein n=1 Tax=Deinococcus pimensis TaxID=309888 RepID=UPI0004897A53|nr:type II secretion system protein [Deinococcus pimensis]
MRRAQGLTLVEMLVALSVLSLALVALAQSQLVNMEQTRRARAETSVKADLVAGIEYVESLLLRYERVSGSGAAATPQNAYFFTWFWNNCGGAAVAGAPTPSVSTALRCQGSVPPARADGAPPAALVAGVTPPATRGGFTFTVSASTAVADEGVLRVVVSSGEGRERLSLTDTVACYDVYPSPTRDLPAPCPAARTLPVNPTNGPGSRL